MPRGSAGRRIVPIDRARPSQVERELSGDDPRWGDRGVVEVVTACSDADSAGVGTSPYRGDFATTGIRVPVAASTPNNRYLFLLCSAVVAAKRAVRLLGLRTLVTMRAEYDDEQAGTTFVFEKEVESPRWTFMDGNVSFHLKWQSMSEERRHFYDAAQPPGTMASAWSGDAGLMYVPPLVGPIPPPYVPLGGGIPMGRDVDYLGTWRDMRYPWHRTSWNLNVPIVGPGTVRLYASVKQTDPATRPAMPIFVTPDTRGWRPEDAFLYSHRDAGPVYGHVAGAMLLDLFPSVKDEESCRT